MMGSTRLSALDIPLTNETRERLVSIGVSSSTISSMSEMGGQALLSLRSDYSDKDHPSCFRRVYDSASALCQGCIVGVSCWRGDRRYLERLKSGKVAPPLGVPSQVVDERIKVVTSRPATPPPPKKKRVRRGKKKSRVGRSRTR